MEVLEDKTLVVLYLKKLGAEGQCLMVEAFRTSVVFNLKDMPVKVYEYYGAGECRSTSSRYFTIVSACLWIFFLCRRLLFVHSFLSSYEQQLPIHIDMTLDFATLKHIDRVYKATYLHNKNRTGFFHNKLVTL